MGPIISPLRLRSSTSMRVKIIVAPAWPNCASQAYACVSHPVQMCAEYVRESKPVTKGSIIRHYPRSRSVCPKLVAHLLDLRRLRFEVGSEGGNL
jgi:hypothetical protein